MKDERPLRHEDYLAMAEELRLYKEENERLMQSNQDLRKPEPVHVGPSMGEVLATVVIILLLFVIAIASVLRKM